MTEKVSEETRVLRQQTVEMLEGSRLLRQQTGEVDGVRACARILGDCHKICHAQHLINTAYQSDECEVIKTCVCVCVCQVSSMSRKKL